MKFDLLHSRALSRKGGEAALSDLLPEETCNQDLVHVPDDRFLAVMTRCIFNAGFNWRVISRKWEGFEAAFLGFDIDALLAAPPDMMDALVSDTRIVRHGTKIKAVFDNARWIRDIRAEHGSFGAWLAAWPANDQVGLMAVLKKSGARLGGNTGQYFLRFAGFDGFVLSRDVLLALKDAGLEIADTPTSKRDLALIQDQFNRWHAETGMAYAHLSRIAALSIGENYGASGEVSEESTDDGIPAGVDLPQV